MSDRALFLLPLFLTAPIALAQGLKPGEVSRAETVSLPITLSGTVLGRDGAPAAGAVVVSSAGGRAVSDGSGSYLLELRVPIEAERIQVTAIGAGSTGLTASTSVSLATTARAVSAGTLLLAQGDPCSPGWLPTFGGMPGTDLQVQTLAAFDDGGGPALYVGGLFTSVGGVEAKYLARWDGTSWSPLGLGVNNSVNAMIVFDDGSGPALYVAGAFTNAGGAGANRVAKWDGTSWTAVGAGVNSTVFALAIFDDGTGPALFVGGLFTSAGGAAASRVAKWSGSTWSALGGGVDDVVRSLAVFDDGSGPALHVGGEFLNAGGAPASRIAKWDGASWAPLGSGLIGSLGMRVVASALAAYDDGSGPALFVGGEFTRAGGLAIPSLAKWDGATWSNPAGGIVSGNVSALTVIDDGAGPALYMGGDFTQVGPVAARSAARWNGSTWSALDGGAQGAVLGLTAFDDGTGTVLYAGGSFSTAGGRTVGNIARWNGSSWAELQDGVNDRVQALATFDDGTGPALYAGGNFTSAGGVPVHFIAKWNGEGWSALGDAPVSIVKALAAFDDGTGPALYVGGLNSLPAGGSLSKWDGTTWSPAGIGTADVEALLVFDDGAGPALYAGGFFQSAGGTSARNIARWDGIGWSPLGTGAHARVRALAVYDDGSGPALYAGGDLSEAGGVAVSNIAKWDGSSWSALGAGVDDAVYALELFDDGSGPALYAGGNFLHAGGVPAMRIARWDGASWSPLPTQVNEVVFSLKTFDDGSGPALFAGGGFTTAGGMAANRIARWDGSGWSALGAGLNEWSEALAAFDDGTGPALYAGGFFDVAYDSGDSFLARWGGCTHLSFDVEDDLETPLVNGQDVSSPPEFGRHVSISSSGPNAGAAIFDSTPGGPNDPSQDRDLLVGSGNLLILQTDQNTTQTVAGVFDRPNDDSDGGTLRFAFPAPVHPCGLTLVDIDAGNNEATTVLQVDRNGNRRTHTVPPGWTGDILLGGVGHLTLDLTTLDPQPGYASTATAVEDSGFEPGAVRCVEVRLGSSGAVDDLHWGHSKTPLLHGPRARPKNRSGASPGVRGVGPR